MPTLANLIERVRVLAGDRPIPDTLNGALTSGQTPITLTSGTKVSPDTLVSIDLETLYVQAKPSTVSATVLRGWDGTTAAAHSSGAVVYVAPRFTHDHYRRAINKALGAISSAFGKRTWDASQSFGTSNRILNAPAGTIRVFDVKYLDTGSDFPKDVPFRYERSLPTAMAADGSGIVLTSWNPGAGVAYIGYESRWTELTALSGAGGTLDADFPAESEDLIELGAWAYLMDAQSFERVAYHAPHTLTRDQARTLGESRMGSQQAIQRFLTRRTECAARHRTVRLGWVKM
ncbi:MAG: hypothetical protein ABIW84_06740 [Ilumatobacteraceae bacterium]